MKKIISLTALLALLAVPASSTGKDGDGRVVRSGDCTGASNWKLKAKPDDGRLEVEFEVDQNRNDVEWHVKLKRNGKTVVSTKRRTRAPSGSLSVEKRIANPAGTDKISATATRDGETCRGSLSV
ncbi:MAG TPA: hypothetical protein VF715_02080 [Thermoleophilaceae bacterium]|jgi:hypothetical protein